MISSLSSDATTSSGQLLAVQAKYGRTAIYQVTVLSLDGAQASNYEISQVSFNFM